MSVSAPVPVLPSRTRPGDPTDGERRATGRRLRDNGFRLSDLSRLRRWNRSIAGRTGQDRRTQAPKDELRDRRSVQSEDCRSFLLPARTGRRSSFDPAGAPRAAYATWTAAGDGNDDDAAGRSQQHERTPTHPATLFEDMGGGRRFNYLAEGVRSGFVYTYIDYVVARFKRVTSDEPWGRGR
jgi:hypothetical protein